MVKKIGSVDPTSEELEFIFKKFVENFTIDALLEDMTDTSFPRRSKRFVMMKKREFDTAKKVLNIHALKVEESWITERKQRHFAEMADIARKLVAGIDSIKLTEDGKYEVMDRESHEPFTIPKNLTHQELVKTLNCNAEYTSQKYRAYGLFDCFKAHLKAENPGLLDLEKIIEDKTVALIQTLNTIYLRGSPKGRCTVCKDW